VFLDQLSLLAHVEATLKILTDFLSNLILILNHVRVDLMWITQLGWFKDNSG
jgi:hypothetical protein